LLDWADVDLRGGLARLWPDTTKAGKQRLVRLLPAAVEAMEGLPHRSGPVWGAVNARKRLLTAARKAGVSLRGVHDFRHTWASWHYALHRDLLRLRMDGGWASVGQVETYAHLMPSGHEGAIRQIWGMARIDTEARMLEGNGV
jgi:integrase